MNVDPITRQTHAYATPIACDDNPRNIIELDPDSDDQDFYILGPEPIKRKPSLMFTPSQINVEYIFLSTILFILATITVVREGGLDSIKDPKILR